MERSRIIPPHLFVFFTGGAVMATEMCASRFLAPWFGTSMIVWSVLIAVVLAALSIGYWIGGKLADRRPSWGLLYSLPVLTGVFITLIPLLGRVFLAMMTGNIRGTPVNVILLSFFGVVVLFVPPVLVLAMVSPYMVRMLAGAGNTGRTAGSLYAMSTMGSIAGTLVPALLTIPMLGTRETLFLAAGVLIMLGGLGLKGRGRLFLLLLILPVAGWLITGETIKGGAGTLEEDETLYQYLQVQRRGTSVTVLVSNEGGAIQSIAREWDTLNPSSTYYESYLLLPYMHPSSDSMDVLVVGSGAGTIPHWLAVHVRPVMPGIRTDAVEIDGTAIDMGFRWFGTKETDARFIHADGRLFLETTDRMYDIVIIDAFSSQIYIPFHLTTLEYFRAIRDHLRESGIVAMNVNALDEDSRLLQSMGKTLSMVFPFVYVAKVSGSFNYMLLASDRSLRAPDPDSILAVTPVLGRTAELFHPVFEPFEPSGGMVLTDNRAPVEFMTDMMIMQEAFSSSSGS